MCVCVRVCASVLVRVSNVCTPSVLGVMFACLLYMLCTSVCVHIYMRWRACVCVGVYAQHRPQAWERTKEDTRASIHSATRTFSPQSEREK